MAPELDDFDGLLRWPALQNWLQVQPAIPGTGPVTAVRRLAGGSQNNVFWCTRDGGEFVLRRPPQHLRPNSNDTMRREARVLAALAGTDVPHPALHALCDDESVIGVCFTVMAAVDGFSPISGLQGRYATDPAWQRAVAFDLVDSAAALGAVDVATVGLTDFGKADDWAVRQVPRWKRQLDGYAAFDGWDPTGLPGIDAVAEWLTDNVPNEHHIGIIHGDLQWANVLLAPDTPRLAAIIDWELSTLGDPLLDLGWILQAWSEPDDPPGHAGSLAAAALPTRAELVARYAARSGRDLTDLRWYEVLACYKLGVILEGSHARACAGKAPKHIGDMLHDYTLWLLSYADHVIARDDRAGGHR
jgi:aminoglycoside phosphotransferase (APT) family kinase protein